MTVPPFGGNLSLAVRRGVAQRLSRGLLRVLARVTVRGVEHLPRGPALLASNHLGHADVSLILSVLPAPPAVLALDALRRTLAGPFVWWYGGIRVRRGEADRAALRVVLEALERGEQVLLFPEGRISPSGALERAKEGVGFLALHAPVPVVPIALTGTERLPWALRHGRPPLTVSIGQPFAPPSLPTGRRAQRQEVTQVLMERIAAMLPEAYRGYYSQI